MVRELNVGRADQTLRIIVSMILLLYFFADHNSLASYLAWGLSALILWTATTRSCELYTLIGFRTVKKTKKLGLETVIEHIVGVVALYLLLFLLKTYLEVG